MDSEFVDVKLHIYDLTRGMAQAMSAAFLGNLIFYSNICLFYCICILHILFQVNKLMEYGTQVSGKI